MNERAIGAGCIVGEVLILNGVGIWFGAPAAMIGAGVAIILDLLVLFFYVQRKRSFEDFKKMRDENDRRFEEISAELKSKRTKF